MWQIIWIWMETVTGKTLGENWRSWRVMPEIKGYRTTIVTGGGCHHFWRHEEMGSIAVLGQSAPKDVVKYSALKRHAVSQGRSCWL
ncbi:MAG: hypothetical protein ACLURV_14440 [Gallintestinimicrobium sp.]